MSSTIGASGRAREKKIWSGRWVERHSATMRPEKMMPSQMTTAMTIAVRGTPTRRFQRNTSGRKNSVARPTA